MHGVGEVFLTSITQGAVRENHVVEFEKGSCIAWRPSEPAAPSPGHLWRARATGVEALLSSLTGLAAVAERA